jgi:hypothetical protein
LAKFVPALKRGTPINTRMNLKRSNLPVMFQARAVPTRTGTALAVKKGARIALIHFNRNFFI